jgi:oligosaccharide repeat unit polymerase
VRGRLADAWQDLWAERGFAIVSPLFAFPLAFTLAYGLGALLHGSRIGDRAVVVGVAAVVGLAAYLVGVSLAWRPIRTDVTMESRRRDFDREVAAGALTLIVVGIVASIAYLLAIGGIPLFMESVEDARVLAAQQGGAALRVLSLLALPGLWLLAGQAGSRRRLRLGLMVALLAMVVAVLQIFTANRAPAFTAIETTVLAAMLGAGLYRLRTIGIALLGLVVLVLVGLAGTIGGYRLSRTPVTWRDPDIAYAVASGEFGGLILKGVLNYLVVPVQNFAATLSAIPDLIPWQLGYTYLQPIITILPGRQSTFDQDLKAALEQEYAGGGTVPSMLGEAYANFGPAGWVIVPLLIGVFLTSLYLYARRRQTAAAWSLYAYALVHMANATISGIVVASLFPYIAYTILGAAAFGEPVYRRLTGAIGQRGGGASTA